MKESNNQSNRLQASGASLASGKDRRYPITAAMLLTTLCVGAQSQDRPNILYIMSDDHAFQCISAYGSDISKIAPTPNIDRIADEGIRFDQAFVENSISTPSRACLMTGLYSHQNGQRQLAEGIDTTLTFFPELLQEAGYQTAVIGKWHMMCNPKGFDYYKVLNDQGPYYNPGFKSKDSNGKYIKEEGYTTDLITDHAIEFLDYRDTNTPFCLMVHHKAPHRAWLPDTKYLGLYDDVTFPHPTTWNDDYTTRGSAVRTQRMDIGRDMQFTNDLKVDDNDLANPNIRRAVGEYGRMNAEQQAAIDAYFSQRSKDLAAMNLEGDALREWKYQTYLRDYLSVIRSVDESVGRLLDYLDKHGLLDNTIVIYTSDQGFYMGEHGWFDKRFMYEESLRTPLLVRYPREIKAGSVSRQLVQNIDYAPTFLDYAGVKKPKELPGRSLKPLFNADSTRWRKDIYYHYYDYPAWHMVRKHDGVRNDRYKLIHFYGKGSERAQAENKYQNMPGTSEYNAFMGMLKSGYIGNDPDIDYYELYDLKADPNELNNVIDNPEYSKVKKDLLKKLKKYRKKLKIDE
jgi:arylsulfatase A-like enzyme